MSGGQGVTSATKRGLVFRRKLSGGGRASVWFHVSPLFNIFSFVSLATAELADQHRKALED